jgi:hypothetical protein
MILRDVEAFLYGTATAVLVLFLVGQWGTYHVATTASNALPTLGRVVSIGVPLGILAASLVFAWWVPRRVRRLSDNV